MKSTFSNKTKSHVPKPAILRHHHSMLFFFYHVPWAWKVLLQPLTPRLEIKSFSMASTTPQESSAWPSCRPSRGWIQGCLSHTSWRHMLAYLPHLIALGCMALDCVLFQIPASSTLWPQCWELSSYHLTPRTGYDHLHPKWESWGQVSDRVQPWNQSRDNEYTTSTDPPQCIQWGLGTKPKNRDLKPKGSPQRKKCHRLWH